MWPSAEHVIAEYACDASGRVTAIVDGVRVWGWVTVPMPEPNAWLRANLAVAADLTRARGAVHVS